MSGLEQYPKLDERVEAAQHDEDDCGGEDGGEEEFCGAHQCGPEDWTCSLRLFYPCLVEGDECRFLLKKLVVRFCFHM